MRITKFWMAVVVTAVASGATGQSITGSIEVKKKLTKRSVTASVPVYQRGTAVKLGADADTDPLALERSRVVLYLEGPGPTGGAAHAGPVQIQQLDRRFSPDVLVVAAGTTVSFPNMDPIFHDVFSLSKPKSFDLGSYDKGETRSVIFSKPGIVDVYCHLHPNMAATIVVTPNRWYAQADRSGRYRIADVPPGQYTLVAWHKAAGYFRKTVVVEAGHDASADFFIPLEDDAHGAAPVKDAAMVMPGDK
jgi:plastocyanin